MTTFSEWFAPRRRVSLWILAGWTSFGVLFAAAWAFAPRLAPIEAPVDRALLALQLVAGPSAVLYLVLQGLWRVFDTVGAEADPLAGAESRGFKITQRVFTNTIEQAAIFAPTFVALAIRMRPDEVWALPVLMGSWCVGRLLFWVGYRIDPPMRAIGMDWTSGAAIVTVLWLGLTLVR